MGLRNVKDIVRPKGKSFFSLSLAHPQVELANQYRDGVYWLKPFWSKHLKVYVLPSGNHVFSCCNGNGTAKEASRWSFWSVLG